MGTDDKLQAAKRRVAIPRLASLSWIRDFDNACKHGTGRGLEFWIPGTPRPFDDPLQPGEEDPGVLVTVMDQQQTQWCAAWFLTNHLDMRAHWLFGPVHRRHNDLDRGLTRAGFLGACLQRLFEVNIAFGPWANGAIFSSMKEQALDMVAAMSPDDGLLLRLWPNICADNNWKTEEEIGVDARQRFIDDFASLKVVQFKGQRASPSRWCSLLMAMQAEDTHFHSKLLLFASLCCRKGWCDHFEDLWGPPPGLLEAIGGPALGPVPKGAIDDAASASGPVTAAAPSSEPAASSSGEVPAAPAKGKGKGATVQQKKQAMHANLGLLINQSVNMMHACTRVMANPDVIHTTRMVLHVAKPLIDEHSCFLRRCERPR